MMPPATLAATLEALATRSERRRGLRLTSVMVACLALLAASIYVCPRFRAQSQGTVYRMLSVQPFYGSVADLRAAADATGCTYCATDVSEAFPVLPRLLTPLTAHVLYLRGDRFLILLWLIAATFLAAIYVCYRRQQYTAVESAGMLSLMAFSTPILFQLRYQGYVDVTSYLCAFLIVANIRRPWWYVVFALSLLNHEHNLFLLPFFLWLAHDGRARVGRVVASLGLAAACIVPMATLRHIALAGVDSSLATNLLSYLDVSAILARMAHLGDNTPLAVFVSFKLFWFFPIAAVYSLLRDGRRSTAFLVGLPVLCAGAQLLFAGDISRLMGLAFPSVLMGAEVMRRVWTPEVFARRLWMLVAFNVLIPQYYMDTSHVIQFRNVFVEILVRLLNVGA